MNVKYLSRVLAAHALWLAGREGGTKADRSGANLSEANLRGANLRKANLAGCDLSGANLRDADLRKCDLRDADLADADLRGCDLRWAVGIRHLTTTDHGHAVVAQQREATGEWRILAGCRDFSIEEARAHWSASDYHTPASGRRIIANIDWLEAELAREWVSR